MIELAHGVSRDIAHEQTHDAIVDTTRRTRDPREEGAVEFGGAHACRIDWFEIEQRPSGRDGMKPMRMRAQILFDKALTEDATFALLV